MIYGRCRNGGALFSKGGESVRYLMWLSLGFSVSCGLRAFGLPFSAWIPLTVFGALLLMCRKWKRLKPGILLSIGCTLGAIWFGLFSVYYLNPAAALDGQLQEVQIQITDYSYETNYGCAADGILTVDEKDYQVRVYINEPVTLEPGQTVSGTFRFRLTAPGGMEEATHHSGKGIFLLAYQRGEVAFGQAAKENWRCIPSRMRQGIRGILAD